MRLTSLLTAAALSLAASAALAAAPTAGLPGAVYADPPVDPAHPASTLSVEITSHGAVMNGMIYRPSGVGPFPLVVFIHGLPGNEQNLDLAQAIRRAGWAVLTFHYRGSWGSEGSFSIDHVMQDADAVLADVSAPGVAQAWNIDPARVVVMGHSLGGLAAAHAAKADPGRLATVLIAPWDPSTLQGLMRPMSPAEREASALARWGVVEHGRLAGTTRAAIAAAVVEHGERWRLADNAAPLAGRPLLIVTAAHDLASSKAEGLKAGLSAAGAKPDAVELDTNHTFDDHRIALEVAVLNWLAKLPGAPAS